MSIFSRAERRMARLSDPASVWEADLGYTSTRAASGVPVSQTSASRLIAVMSCQSLIADGVSTLPLSLYRTRAGRPEKVNPSSIESWIERPNPIHGPIALWSQVVLSLLQDGNAFLATIRDSAGFVRDLYCLDPRLVQVDRVEPTDVRSELIYRYQGFEYNRSEILHIPGPFLHPGAMRALSPIDLAREAIGLGLAIEEYGARFFSQGTTMAGVIQHPGSPKPDEARTLREMFRKTHSGLKNSHAIGVLTGGATWQSVTVTPEQAQFLDTRRFQKLEIALLYRVPAHMIDPTIQSSWGSGVEEQNSWFLTQTVQPWITRIEEYVSLFLLGRGRYIKWNMDARLRPKTKDRYESYAIGLNNGWLCVDEIRAREDMDPLPKGLGQRYFRPLNHADITAPSPIEAGTQRNPALSTSIGMENDESDN